MELGRHDMVDVVELAMGEEYAVPVRQLRGGRAGAAAVSVTAKRVYAINPTVLPDKEA